MDKIINYVKHTPENTNPAVLATLLGDLNKQSDWNQNDDTQPDYVKNRPFYTGGPVETVLVEERTVLFEKDPKRDLYIGEFKSTFSTTVGETYKVSWDGTTYECTCIDGMFSSIGNLSIIGEGSDTGEPFLLRVDHNLVGIITADTASSHTISISIIAEEVVKINPKYLPTPFEPKGKSYLTFSSPNKFTLSKESGKSWNGTLEYFASDETWTTWSGENALSAVDNGGEYVIYLRGIGNSVITGEGLRLNWKLVGTDIKCIGNIENILDYATVESGNHPIMHDSCYQDMFFGCTSLTQAPELPATTLANYCYCSMFSGCTSLTQAPKLPATTLAHSCYKFMFHNCRSLTQAPELPATTLAVSCYERMFDGCTSLTQAPELPATTLANSCYKLMFSGCTSLTQALELPATTLADSCYERMFDSCTSLTQAPELPATTLAKHCYCYMFQNCTSLTQAPELPATTLTSSCYSSMFNNCRSLTQAPELPATTLANSCYSYMFQNCTSLKLSSTKTDKYIQEYRIPSSGNGVIANYALLSMFDGTGGTFTGEPKINTTYYLSSDNMIVRETQTATLNGYVNSIVDNAIEKYADTGEYIIPSSTEGSTKKFKIAVDDSGTISATEVKQVR